LESEEKTFDLTLYVGTTHFPGRVIVNDEFDYFISLSIGKKLEHIRIHLNEIYKGEYTWRKVSQIANISYQGLRDIENEDSIPRYDTVEILADHYDVPWLKDNEYDKMQGFYLAKDKDRNAFFDNFFLFEGGTFHPLDNRPRKNLTNEEEIQEDNYILDEYGFPIVETDEEIVKDSFSLEVSMNAYGTLTGESLREDIIEERSVLTTHDIEHLKDMITREIRYLTEKNEKHLKVTSDIYELLIPNDEGND
jgi:transcriptional regulator with XRE-family HTH domain